jgi:hypothetical protein
MFDSLERARIVAIVPRARNAPGTTDKLQKPTTIQKDTIMRTLTVLMLTAAAYALYDGAAAGTEIDLVKGICSAIMLAMPVPFLLAK